MATQWIAVGGLPASSLANATRSKRRQWSSAPCTVQDPMQRCRTMQCTSTGASRAIFTLPHTTTNAATRNTAHRRVGRQRQLSASTATQHIITQHMTHGVEYELAVEAGIAEEKGEANRSMQDRHVVIHHVAAHAPAAAAQAIADAQQPSILVGVFDGHGGSTAAHRASQMLSDALPQEPHMWQLLGHAASQGHLLGCDSFDEVQSVLARTVRLVDRDILDQDRVKLPHLLDGTTALVGIQVGRNLLVVNVGDCRAVLSRAGQAVRITHDHTPGDERERQCVTEAGGEVGQHHGSWRVVLNRGQGLCVKLSSVTRALGDLEFKTPRAILSSTPDVHHVGLQPGDDKLVIYASDGIWSVMSDQQAVDTAAAALTQAQQSGLSASECAQAAATALLQQARSQGSQDDITAVVTPLLWSATHTT